MSELLPAIVYLCLSKEFGAPLSLQVTLWLHLFTQKHLQDMNYFPVEFETILLVVSKYINIMPQMRQRVKGKQLSNVDCSGGFPVAAAAAEKASTIPFCEALLGMLILA